MFDEDYTLYGDEMFEDDDDFDDDFPDDDEDDYYPEEGYFGLGGK